MIMSVDLLLTAQDPPPQFDQALTFLLGHQTPSSPTAFL